MRGDLLEALRSPFILSALANYQTRVLGTDIDLRTRAHPDRPLHGHLMEAPASDADMPAIFERAKRRLESMLAVGTVERFEETVDLVCQTLDIKRPDVVPYINVSHDQRVQPSHRQSGTISDQQIRQVDERLAYDRALYAFADALLTRRLNEREGPQKRRLWHRPRL
jgi:hypothetical protein